MTSADARPSQYFRSWWAAINPQIATIVAVAANFTEPMNEIAEAFEKATGHSLHFTYIVISAMQQKLSCALCGLGTGWQYSLSKIEPRTERLKPQLISSVP